MHRLSDLWNDVVPGLPFILLGLYIGLVRSNKEREDTITAEQRGLLFGMFMDLPSFARQVWGHSTLAARVAGAALVFAGVALVALGLVAE